MDDAARFDALRLAFEVVQIPADKIEGIVSVVAAILWLGNLAFAQSEDSEDVGLTAADKQVVDTVAKLLGLQEEELKQVRKDVWRKSRRQASLWLGKQVSLTGVLLSFATPEKSIGK